MQLPTPWTYEEALAAGFLPNTAKWNWTENNMALLRETMENLMKNWTGLPQRMYGIGFPTVFLMAESQSRTLKTRSIR
jgi:hypothetical protein